MRCWWEKHHPKKWIFTSRFLWCWWQYCSPRGDGSWFPFGLTEVGLGLACPLLWGTLHPRWRNVFDFGSLCAPDGITLPKHAYNWENRRCFAHSFGPCVHSCFHFQLSSSFSREDECLEMSSLPVILASFHGLPRPESCNWNLFQHRNKCREGSNQRGDDGAPDFSYPRTFSVSVIILFHIYNSIN